MEKVPQSLLYNDVVIIGAGFSGINFACQLQKQLGLDNYLIYERGSAIGGTWSVNTCKSGVSLSLY